MQQVEIWKEVPQSLYYYGVGHKYEASNLGRVRNKLSGHILKPSPMKRNKNQLKVNFHRTVGFDTLSFLLSHVIYETFIGHSYYKRIRFKDGNPNNCAVDNLYTK